MKSGYNSHYILVNRSGYPAELHAKKFFDEMVIGQESQVVPAFVVSLTSECAMDHLKGLDRKPMPEESDISLDVF
jgi:hypothetical protein